MEKPKLKIVIFVPIILAIAEGRRQRAGGRRKILARTEF
jgi:hypothetical protein